MIKAVFDTNIFVGWFRDGSHEELMLGRSHSRYLSAVVQMELRVGATTAKTSRALDQMFRTYARAGRRLAPSPDAFDQAGRVLRRLRDRGREVRRASLVNDLLIAVTARMAGATLFTADASDFLAIHEAFPFELEVVSH
jgi:predicted nucleic acid-binding protein